MSATVAGTPNRKTSPMTTDHTNDAEAARLAALYITALNTGDEAAIAECEAALTALGQAEDDARAAAKVAARERTEARRQRVRDGACPMCGGTGYRPKFAHIHGGVCYRCDGKG